MSDTGHELPGVSVMMAAYNAAGSLESAVRSIQDQTFTDWELVIVDDGSRDATRELLIRLAGSDPRIRLELSDVNRGLAASLNHALPVCRAGLIARMDADDRSLPERLALQVSFMRDNPDVDVLGGCAIELDEDGREVGTSCRPADHARLVGRIHHENPFIHPTVMVRRSALVALGGYDVTLRRGQDYDLWLRASSRFRFHNLEKPLIWYSRRRAPRWRDAWYSSRIVFRALRRDGQFLRALLLASRPPAATAWARLTAGARSAR
jgi:glycosyltransferase involved in cell wall biosynthesis